MKPVFSCLILAAVLAVGMAEAQASSCPDQNSQADVGMGLVLQEAGNALPNQANDLEYTVSEMKTHTQSKLDRYWDADQPDSLTFDIVIGKKSIGSRFPYSPAVAYEVSVDTSCKAVTRLLYSIE